MDYQKDIHIDHSALDIEIIEQSSKMFKYAQYSAEMRKEMDFAQAELDRVIADLETRIRKDPETFGINKMNNNIVEATIKLDVEYKEALADLHAARFEYNIASAASEAINARKSLLSNLVQLHGQQYFAGPDIPRNLSKVFKDKEEQEELQKKTNNQISKTLKRKKNG